MPVNQFETLQALRDRLVTLDLSGTPATSLSVVAGTPFGKIVRTSGSFIDDLYAAGMEVLPAGFSDGANNALAVVKVVDALELTLDRPMETEAAAGGKSITVGLPSRIAPENIEFTPDQDKPYVEEHFLPANTEQITIGPGGDIQWDPLYLVRFYLPADTGPEAANLYGDALMSLFAPRTAMTLTNGDIVRVRTNPGPFRGQILQLKPGWATVPVTIPLRIRTINP
jgi:hypothetical protein